MNWNEVYEWLKHHGHVNDSWDRIDITDSFYAEDEFDNTFISIFTRGSDAELVIYIGCLQPKISVGGATAFTVENHWDVIDYLHDNLEAMYLDLAKKYVNLKKESE